MRDHVRILGILNIVMGCLTALIGVVLFLVLGGAAGVISTAYLSDVETGQAVGPILAIVGVCVGIFFIVLALPSIIGGWGLLNFRPWARILVIILSVLHLFNFPFGTALGVYGLWVLLGEGGRQVFQTPAQAYFPANAYPQAGQSPPGPYPPQRGSDV